VALLIFDVILIIINQNKNLYDLGSEVIAQIAGLGGILLAVWAMVDASQQDRAAKRMMEEIAQLNRDADDDEKVNNEFQRKLDKILTTENRIERKLDKAHATHARRGQNK
jgi:septal ring factor EnvC (AmiA/AmiB activator)